VAFKRKRFASPNEGEDDHPRVEATHCPRTVWCSTRPIVAALNSAQCRPIRPSVEQSFRMVEVNARTRLNCEHTRCRRSMASEDAAGHWTLSVGEPTGKASQVWIPDIFSEDVGTDARARDWGGIDLTSIEEQGEHRSPACDGSNTASRG
jgi:hypothetical protein